MKVIFQYNSVQDDRIFKNVKSLEFDDGRVKFEQEFEGSSDEVPMPNYDSFIVEEE